MKVLFQTERITCREFVQGDLQSFADYRALPEVARYQGWSEYRYQDAVSLFEEMQKVPFATVGHWFQLAIVTKSSIGTSGASTPSQLLGDLAVHFIDENQIEIGFTFAPDFQGQGFASEAVLGLLTYLFTVLKPHRVIATTDTENVPSWLLLERVGFRREAHFIENVFFKGAWGSEFQYAMLASEWRPVVG
ncbi:GNAT family N-acetyltransferase [Shewanella eurypsychrophilus]|uniref:GNAT family N-acetyltransferase n=1 Tax=Shewanella eurypsychrophilus TaxID=2593656 RepID=A0ABX6VBT7_9GAMM|nr:MULTISPECIES: GNAT family protein [Shewanella]QFU24981.1 GNAT family N-acetyltransferase [Shewanella sp. YLB-09]QPG60157.1 GNAT family N-acetyltransferase [Shewanella eurypsychrophilus]